jgi:hypothetical protein
MVVTKVWRESLVTMFYGTRPNTDTPTPFCEIRAFIYLPAKPTLAETSMLKRRLKDAIDGILDKPSMLKRLGQAIGRGSVSRQSATNAEELEYYDLPSGKIKVRIDGHERELVDVIETQVHVDNTDIKHKIVKVLPKKTLPTFNYIFRYVAFFGPEGKIKGDYDEFDILDGALD